MAAPTVVRQSILKVLDKAVELAADPAMSQASHIGALHKLLVHHVAEINAHVFTGPNGELDAGYVYTPTGAAPFPNVNDLAWTDEPEMGMLRDYFRDFRSRFEQCSCGAEECMLAVRALNLARHKLGVWEGYVTRTRM